MKNKNKAVFGVILIIIGIILLGRSLNVFYISFNSLIPIIFIFLGIWIILRKRKQEKIYNQNIYTNTNDNQSTFTNSSNNFQKQQETDYQEKSQSDTQHSFHDSHTEKGYYSSSNYGQEGAYRKSSNGQTGKLRYSKAFGDLFIDFNNMKIQDIAISIGFGDLELKLHGSILSEGLNRIVISSFIGDIRILVPKDIAIYMHCSNFIGDIDAFGKHSSGFGNSLNTQTPTYNSATKKLFIATSNFIGDIKIYQI
ncbi:MAG: cell wall-active antibiotics response protein [FCB group bacterium]|nr:cell wall-active antibiotics response protein [FCB group bacterium]